MSKGASAVTRKILIVDDRPTNLRMLNDVLAREGYEIVTASDGEQALQAAQENLPDLVLLDVRMSGMDGYEVCRQLKQNPDTGEIPVIFMSALDELQDKMMGFSAGGVDYVAKPFQPEEMLARIETHLSLRAMQQQLAAQNAQLEQEIAERRRAEAALDESQRTLATLLNNLPGMAYRCLNDPQWTMQFVSDGCRKLTGYEPDDLILNRKASYADLIHVEDREQVWKAVQEAVETNQSFEITYRLLTAGGETRWVWERGVGLPLGKRDDYIYIEGFISDITERRVVEIALRRSEEKFKALFEAAPVAMFVANQDGSIERLNEKFVELLGYTEGDVPTLEDWWERAFPDPKQRRLAQVSFGAAVESADREGRGAERVETAVTGRDNSLRYIETSFTPIGEQTIYALYDHTQIKEKESQLQASKQQLEKALAELQAAQQQLVQQERMAAVGQLAAGLAHDYNNMMASILLYTDMLLTSSSSLGPTERRQIKAIQDQGQRAAERTQQILDFGRQAVLKRKELDLKPFLVTLCEQLKHTLPATIQIEMDVDRPDAWVFADPDRFRQTMINLALNAREAMPGGGVLCISLDVGSELVHCAACKRSVSGEWVKVSVSDTGRGIDPLVRPHIFEPFFTTRAPLGSGLGLSQVYGIMHQHDGHIGVESQLGVGTCFNLFLPQLQQKADELAGKGARILLVEDDVQVRQAMTAALEMLGYQVYSVTGAQQAVDLIAGMESGPSINLVIGDVELNGADGLELARELWEQSPHLKVILMSSSSMGQQVGVQLGNVAGWLAKPADLDQLAQVVSEVLESGD